MKGGGIPLLVDLLSSTNVKVQAASAAALWQLCGERQIVEEIGTAGGPRAAVHALQARNSAVQENAAGLVASLAQSHRNAVRLAVVEEQRWLGTGRPPWKDVCSTEVHRAVRMDGTRSLWRSAPVCCAATRGWSGSGRAKGRGAASFQVRQCGVQAALTDEGAIEHLVPLLRSRTTEIQVYAADSLRCIAGARDENRLLIAGSSISTLILLLGSPQPDAQLSAAGQAFSASRALDLPLVLLVKSSSRAFGLAVPCESGAWVSAGCLSALAGNAEVRERIGQSGAIPHLVQLLRTGNPQVRSDLSTGSRQFQHAMEGKRPGSPSPDTLVRHLPRALTSDPHVACDINCSYCGASFAALRRECAGKCGLGISLRSGCRPKWLLQLP